MLDIVWIAGGFLDVLGATIGEEPPLRRCPTASESAPLGVSPFNHPEHRPGSFPSKDRQKTNGDQRVLPVYRPTRGQPFGVCVTNSATVSQVEVSLWCAGCIRQGYRPASVRHRLACGNCDIPAPESHLGPFFQGALQQNSALPVSVLLPSGQATANPQMITSSAWSLFLPHRTKQKTSDR
jgi:hypothetical protein